MREGLKYGTFRVRRSFRAVESTSGSRRSTVLLLVPVPSLPNFIIHVINFQRTYRHTTSIVAVGTRGSAVYYTSVRRSTYVPVPRMGTL